MERRKIAKTGRIGERVPIPGTAATVEVVRMPEEEVEVQAEGRTIHDPAGAVGSAAESGSMELREGEVFVSAEDLLDTHLPGWRERLPPATLSGDPERYAQEEESMPRMAKPKSANRPEPPGEAQKGGSSEESLEETELDGEPAPDGAVVEVSEEQRAKFLQPPPSGPRVQQVSYQGGARPAGPRVTVVNPGKPDKE